MTEVKSAPVEEPKVAEAPKAAPKSDKFGDDDFMRMMEEMFGPKKRSRNRAEHPRNDPKNGSLKVRL